MAQFVYQDRANNLGWIMRPEPGESLAEDHAIRFERLGRPEDVVISVAHWVTRAPQEMDSVFEVAEERRWPDPASGAVFRLEHPGHVLSEHGSMRLTSPSGDVGYVGELQKPIGHLTDEEMATLVERAFRSVRS